MLFQNIVCRAWPLPLNASSLFQWPGQRRVPGARGDGREGFQRDVRAFDVGRVVDVVVQVHRLLVDGGFERGVIVRQRRQDEFAVLEADLAVLGGRPWRPLCSGAARKKRAGDGKGGGTEPRVLKASRRGMGFINGKLRTFLVAKGDDLVLQAVPMHRTTLDGRPIRAARAAGRRFAAYCGQRFLRNNP